jgi:hypothetical protein
MTTQYDPVYKPHSFRLQYTMLQFRHNNTQAYKGTCNDAPVHNLKAYWGTEVKLHAFLTWEID